MRLEKLMVVMMAIATASALTSCAGGDANADAKQAYEAAQQLVKERMKSPSSTRFPAFSDDKKAVATDSTLEYKSDSLDISGSLNLTIVEGHYESQNTFGVFLPGEFRAQVKKDSTGKWVPLWDLEGFKDQNVTLK